MTPRRYGRRRFIAVGLGLAAGTFTGNAAARMRSWGLSIRAATGSGTPAFVTQPAWNPPTVTVGTPAAGTAPGLVFVTPNPAGLAAAGPGQAGPTILDNSGQPVWFLPLATELAQNFRVQTYHGKPVLTWYEGPSGNWYGGSDVIYDSNYREIKRVHGGNGYSCDQHEFLITQRNTALISIYNTVTTSLAAIGGAGTGLVTEGIVQEIDIDRKKVLFEWHSLDHVGLDESFNTTPDSSGIIDYFHLNSIDVDTDGNLLLSARFTSTIYKIDRKTGNVIWRLGGKKSNFQMGPAATFNFQHDARSHPDGTLTLFDNGACPQIQVESMSRGMRLSLDTEAMAATLVQAYEPPVDRLALALGDTQQQPHGGVFVGWGTASAFSEFAPDGTLVFDASFPSGIESYRAFRFPWVGRPATQPAVVATNTGSGEMTVAVSWNGATEVARWQLRAGPTPKSLSVVATVPRSGFETTIAAAPAAYAAVTALDVHGNLLGSSPTVAVAS
jgi:hypothetical protein